MFYLGMSQVRKLKSGKEIRSDNKAFDLYQQKQNIQSLCCTQVEYNIITS